MISSEKKSNKHSLYSHLIKKTSKFMFPCQTCGKELKFGIEQRVLSEITNFPFAHAIIHGNPLHCMVVYIDKNFHVRGGEIVNSLEILRDQETFGQLLKKWSNPF
jgi:hypothetical protein